MKSTVADPLRRPARRSRASTAFRSRTSTGRSYDLVVGAVAHNDYRELPDARIEAMVAPDGTLADLKGMWRDRTLDPGDRPVDAVKHDRLRAREPGRRC